MAEKESIEEEAESVGRELSFFEKYLSIWVALCIIAGVALGRFLGWL